jgi:MYXO-CTERM domain-containing protein
LRRARRTDDPKRPFVSVRSATAARASRDPSRRRADRRKVVGSANHGFDAPTPYGIFDGKAHENRPYAIDSRGGTNPELGAVKSLTCTPKPPASVKRHVADPTSYAAWAFVRFRDVLLLADATLDPIAAGADFPATPALVRGDDNSREVWLVDGAARRHVSSPAVAAAWHLDLSKVVVKPAAQIAAMPVGAPLRDRPILAQGSGPAVYVLDDPAFDQPPASGGPSGGGGGSAPGGSPGGSGSGAPQDQATDASGDSGGCAIPSADPSGVPFVLAALFLFTRRRRRHGV